MLNELVGLIMIAGSFQVKMPIISKCIEQGSTQGLPEDSVLLETSSMVIGACYNTRNGFPLLSWGEGLTLLAQNLVLLGCIWYYNQVETLAVAKKMGRFFALAAVNFMLPMAVMPVMPIMSMLIGWSATLPLIRGNYLRKHTGQLSLSAQSAVVGGSFARLYTTLTAVDDLVMQFGSIVGTTLQTTILVQILLLQGNTKIWQEKQQRGEPVEADEFQQIGQGFFARIERSPTFKRISRSRAVSTTRDAVMRLSQSRGAIQTRLAIRRYYITLVGYWNQLVAILTAVFNQFRKTRVISALELLYHESEEVFRELPDPFYIAPTFDVFVDKIYGGLKWVLEPMLAARDQFMVDFGDWSGRAAEDVQGKIEEWMEQSTAVLEKATEQSKEAMKGSLEATRGMIQRQNWRPKRRRRD